MFFFPCRVAGKKARIWNAACSLLHTLCRDLVSCLEIRKEKLLIALGEIHLPPPLPFLGTGWPGRGGGLAWLVGLRVASCSAGLVEEAGGCGSPPKEKVPLSRCLLFFSITNEALQCKTKKKDAEDGAMNREARRAAAPTSPAGGAGWICCSNSLQLW